MPLRGTSSSRTAGWGATRMTVGSTRPVREGSPRAIPSPPESPSAASHTAPTQGNFSHHWPIWNRVLQRMNGGRLEAKPIIGGVWLLEQRRLPVSDLFHGVGVEDHARGRFVPALCGIVPVHARSVPADFRSWSIRHFCGPEGLPVQQNRHTMLASAKRTRRSQ